MNVQIILNHNLRRALIYAVLPRNLMILHQLVSSAKVVVEYFQKNKGQDHTQVHHHKKISLALSVLAMLIRIMKEDILFVVKKLKFATSVVLAQKILH